MSKNPWFWNPPNLFPAWGDFWDDLVCGQQAEGLIEGAKAETNTIVNIPSKHAGIAIGDDVRHYSNSQDKVVKVSMDRVRRRYTGTGFEIYYGNL